MMHDFGKFPPEDIRIEREVENAIKGGATVPRWGWPVPPPYNGSSGRARIVGWQKVRIAENLGLLPPRGHCSLCQAALAEHRHTELYLRPLISLPTCRSCHYAVHRRFTDPSRWQVFVEQRAVVSGWATSLRMVELNWQEAVRIAAAPDIFAALAAT